MSPAFLSIVIFSVALLTIFSERIDRTIVAMVGAAAMVGAGEVLGFYREHEAIEAIDFETIGLLLGMMILVALLQPTGFFEYIAIRAARISRGNPFSLLILLGAVTTVLSMILDNVTTVVLIAPVTILVSEILGVSPIPFLVAEAILSNTGGVATLIGDPPNILIGSAAGLTFNDFLTHSLPVVVVAWFAALGLLLLLSRRRLQREPQDPTVLERLDPTEALHDPATARKVAVVLALTVVLFLFQGRLELRASYLAMSMAALAVLWVRPPVHELLARVEWTVLVFFGGLFVMVGGLEHAGVLEAVASQVVRLSVGDPRIVSIGIIWISAVASALVDNVPITVALIPVIADMGQNGVNISPMWWALAFGAGFGGNATIIGSTANIVVAELSKQTREPIRSGFWVTRGLPVMLVTCLIASLAFVLAFPLFAR